MTGLTTILGNSPVLALALRTYPIVWFRQRVRAKVTVSTSCNPDVRIVHGGYLLNDVKVRGLMRHRWWAGDEGFILLAPVCRRSSLWL